MSSNAFAGVGTQFLRGAGGSSSAQYQAIAEINSIAGPDKSRATIDVTSLDSVDGYREFIASFRDAGTVVLEMNFTRDGFDDMNDDFESDDAVDYRIILPDTGNTQFDFSALVSDLGMAVPLDDKVTASVSLKITGPVTLTT
jgi:predicted secreted protein